MGHSPSVVPSAKPPAGCNGHPPSDIQILGECGALLDEAEAGFRLGAHEVVHRFCNCTAVSIAEFDAEKGAPPRIHCRFLELPRAHLTQAFEAAEPDLPAAAEHRAQKAPVARI